MFWLTPRNARKNEEKYRESKSLAQAKQGETMVGSGPAVKCLRVESLDPSEGNSEDGNMLEQEAINQLPPKIAMAQYPTNVIMHLGLHAPPPTMFAQCIPQCLIQPGDAEKEMPQVQMAAEVTEGTELISMQESVVQEAWHGWEESLRMANRMRRVGAVALQDESTWEPPIPARRLTQEEWENLEKWKGQFLEEWDSFEEDGMEVDAFRLDEWDE